MSSLFYCGVPLVMDSNSDHHSHLSDAMHLSRGPKQQGHWADSSHEMDSDRNSDLHDHHHSLGRGPKRSRWTLEGSPVDLTVGGHHRMSDMGPLGPPQSPGAYSLSAHSPGSNSSTSASGVFSSRKQREFIPDAKKDDCYWDRRRRNNEAAKR